MQFIYCGKKATLSIGNVKPVGDMPEGSIVCNVEEVMTQTFPAIIVCFVHWTRLLPCLFIGMAVTGIADFAESWRQGVFGSCLW